MFKCDILRFIFRATPCRVVKTLENKAAAKFLGSVLYYANSFSML